MRCLETHELVDFLEGRLSPEDRDAVEAHLDACAACRLVVVELTRGAADESPAATGEDAGAADVSPAADPAVPEPAYPLRTTLPSELTAPPGGLPLVREAPGRYQVQRELRRGGQARILEVYDTVLGRTVALKELLDLPWPEAPESSLPTAALRFIREARIAGRLDHPAIVHVHELGVRHHAALYYTMPLVRGRTLSEAIARADGLPARLSLLRHFEALCLGVAYAHSQGVLHRDIKPQNVMIGEFGETVLLDWGLAKITRPPEGIDGRPAALDADAALTAAGTALGTPAYMSPEQAAGQLDEVDERSDVWGLGAVLFEILTGAPPFSGGEPAEIMERVLTGRHPAVRALCPEAPADLAAVAERGLQRSRSDRYPSVQALLAAFQAARSSGPSGAGGPARGGAPADPAEGPARATAAPAPVAPRDRGPRRPFGWLLAGVAVGVGTTLALLAAAGRL